MQEIELLQRPKMLPAADPRPVLIGADLAALCASWGEPAYRARQVARWLYQEHEFDPALWHDLPKRFRDRVATETRPFPLELDLERTADRGLTSKALLRLADGNLIESVLMRYPSNERGRARRTVCVSSQVGCAVGCPFCATGLLGLKRHLTSAEIAGQVLYFASRVREIEDAEARITNVVFMGEGEPLANIKNVWPAIELLNAADGVGLGARRVTISTSGLAPRIRDLAQQTLQVGLAISLHAPTDELRDRLVPVNRKYKIAEVLDACREYVVATHRRVSFEYAMMDGINDSLAQAETLAGILKGLLSHVNLIPLNHVEGSSFEPTPWRKIEAFQDVLRKRGISCTVRMTRGDEIEGACGQLRAAVAELRKQA
ncbi:MAG TPA: 23S rRNA (adenine(2503)-C(2))-methyltransferase RlmN [Chloroflexota bacterium]|nr:23S rRNA (adenine(2503)-C(2))-methyltransferase RlmN [Chloroflexota bacterium]